MTLPEIYFVMITIVFFFFTFALRSLLSTFFYFIFIFITDTLKIVRDGKYGAKNPKENGGWDGMVGELVRRVSENFTI